MTPAPIAGERGGIITGWILRIVILMSLFAFSVFEAGAIIVAKVQVDEVAIDAASAAAARYQGSRPEERARDAAERAAQEQGATVVDLRVDRARAMIVVTVQKKARTVIVHRIGALRNHTVARATHQASIG